MEGDAGFIVCTHGGDDVDNGLESVSAGSSSIEKLQRPPSTNDVPVPNDLVSILTPVMQFIFPHPGPIEAGYQR